ncbi:hypothetical protein N656DRAFT_488369 [Canariomyces notabilis]|uniref:Uncharacterized protein n=1 Tax=Canariomyces notabilis TaxID=2074819 RepID=A0AAN6YV48_9PEZI|nr:hypothetical protein N656DRAFT_488369 [Canariomyces arenarius]
MLVTDIGIFSLGFPFSPLCSLLNLEPCPHQKGRLSPFQCLMRWACMGRHCCGADCAPPMATFSLEKLSLCQQGYTWYRNGWPQDC